MSRTLPITTLLALIAPSARCLARAASSLPVIRPKVTELGEWRNVNAHTPQEPALSLRGTLMNKHGGLDAAVPIPLQLGLSATLGRLAEVLGYRGVYDRYVS